MAKKLIERYILAMVLWANMSERKKRIQEIDATLENCVALMVELYNEKAKLKDKMEHGSSDLSVQKV